MNFCATCLNASRDRSPSGTTSPISTASSLLVIEVDGDSHYTIGGAAHDVRRDAALVAQGLRVIRFTNSEVMQQFEGVCERIRNALKT